MIIKQEASAEYPFISNTATLSDGGCYCASVVPELKHCFTTYLFKLKLKNDLLFQFGIILDRDRNWWHNNKAFRKENALDYRSKQY